MNAPARLMAVLLAGLALVAGPAPAQPDTTRRTGTTVADTGVAGWRFEHFTLEAADGHARYRIRVALPTAPAPAGGHPVAYLLDGNAALMDTDAALLARLAAAPRPPVIAYIAHDNDLRIDADARAFDYTPLRAGGPDAQRDAIGERRNGGADAFLALVTTQVAPRVEEMAPIDASRRALWGHSYGGVFVLHALFSRPDAFAIHAAADPSLWWGEGHLLQAVATADAFPAPAPMLWLWRGEGGVAPAHGPPPGRDPAAVEAMRRARASVPADAAERLVAGLRSRGVTVDAQALPGLGHGQTLGASMERLLERLAGAAADPAPSP